MQEKDSATTNANVLVVDDDRAVRTVLATLLQRAGMKAREADSGEQALDVIGREPIDLVVTDVRMPGMGGMRLLSEVSERWSDVPVIVLTAHGTVQLAVEAMKAGAADFVTKPFDRDEILYAVQKALLQGRHAARGADAAPVSPRGMVLVSQAMKSVSALVARAAQGTATVLLRGESGTGKELAARAIHEMGPRASGPFVKIHCAALPEALLESELFGYEKGAFTGAVVRKPGRVELAHGGTLFLDEIGDISASTQVKLLRVLQEREFERLGGTQTIKVDVRFVAATHRDLDSMVAKGEFREDLFYRLAVIPIRLPPLRERREEIAPLVAHFCKTLGAANAKPRASFDAEALALLEAEAWPGNVRQLQNFVERLVVLCDGETMTAAEVRRELARGTERTDASASRVEAASDAPPSSSSAPAATPAPGRVGSSAGETLDSRRREVEKETLVNALARAGGNRSLAARLLGVSRRTLYYKLAQYGVG